MEAVRSRQQKIKLLESELKYWEDKMSKDKANATLIHGGYCEVLSMLQMIEKVNIKDLRVRFNNVKSLALVKIRKFDLAKANKSRIEHRLVAISRVGKALKNKKIDVDNQ